MPDQRIHGRMIPNEVTVLLAGGVETRVEFLADGIDGNDTDVVREPGIEGKREFARRHLRFGARHLEMGGHAEGMDAGIGAAGTVKAWMRWKEFGQGGFDFFLDAGAGFLDLPAFI